MRIRITFDGGAITGSLNDSATAQTLYKALPFSSVAHTWGEEAYFEAPIEAALSESPQVVVEPGTICFWVQGGAVALPYGPTPVSEGDECRLVTAVNVIGRIDGAPRQLANLEEGAEVTMEKAE